MMRKIGRRGYKAKSWLERKQIADELDGACMSCTRCAGMGCIWSEF